MAKTEFCQFLSKMTSSDRLTVFNIHLLSTDETRIQSDTYDESAYSSTGVDQSAAELVLIRWICEVGLYTWRWHECRAFQRYLSLCGGEIPECILDRHALM
jgi:hypothetical protein